MHKLINMYDITVSKSYLHKNSIIHRDLRLVKLLMDQCLFLNVDFCLSKSKLVIEQTMTIESTAPMKGATMYMKYQST